MELLFVKPPFSVNNGVRSSNRADLCPTTAFACPARADTMLRSDGGGLKGLPLITWGNTTKSTEPANSSFTVPSICLSELVLDFLDDPTTAISTTAATNGRYYDSVADTACGLAALQSVAAKGAPASTWSQRGACECGSPRCEGQNCRHSSTAGDRDDGYDATELTQMVESLAVCQTAEECRLFVDVLAALKETRRALASSLPATAAPAFDRGSGEADGGGQQEAKQAGRGGNELVGVRVGGLTATGRTCAAVVRWLQDKGYDAALCESRWEHRKGLPGGSHEYIDVILGTPASPVVRPPPSRAAAMSQEHSTRRHWPSPIGAPHMPSATRLLIDIDFRAQFHVARPSLEYASLLQAAPLIFVGRSERLQQLVEVLCSAMHRSLTVQGMHIPPWRRADYLRAKWGRTYWRLPVQLEDQALMVRERVAALAELNALNAVQTGGGVFDSGSAHAGTAAITHAKPRRTNGTCSSQGFNITEKSSSSSDTSRACATFTTASKMFVRC